MMTGVAIVGDVSENAVPASHFSYISKCCIVLTLAAWLHNVTDDQLLAVVAVGLDVVACVFKR